MKEPKVQQFNGIILEKGTSNKFLSVIRYDRTEATLKRLERLFNTIPGERVGGDDEINFGINLRKYCFESWNRIPLDMIKKEIEQKIEKYEPLLNVIDIEFQKLENEYTLNITVYLQFIDTNELLPPIVVYTNLGDTNSPTLRKSGVQTEKLF